MLTRVAIKLSQDRFPQDELKIMKKYDSQFVIKLLDSFSIEIPYYGSLYGIVMDYYEVRINCKCFRKFSSISNVKKERRFSESNCRQEKIPARSNL